MLSAHWSAHLVLDDALHITLNGKDRLHQNYASGSGIRRDAATIEAWLKEVAPSNELRRWFGHGPRRWEEFKRRYRRELESRPDVLEPLLQAARESNVTLVYSARDEQHNQAVVIKDVLEDVLKGRLRR